MRRDMFEPASASDWLRHAQSDLVVAKGPLAPGVLYETLCFHAQQAAEKSIKAVLIHHSIEFPYTHSIARLITVTKENAISWPAELDDAAELSDYAVQLRYPSAYVEVTEEEYVQAIAVAEKVFQWAEGVVANIE